MEKYDDRFETTSDIPRIIRVANRNGRGLIDLDITIDHTTFVTTLTPDECDQLANLLRQNARAVRTRHISGHRWLKTKFYPVSIDRKVIYYDPQPRERDCSYGKYDVMVEKTIGIHGVELLKHADRYADFEVLPPKGKR